jgi:hypothetical protein
MTENKSSDFAPALHVVITIAIVSIICWGLARKALSSAENYRKERAVAMEQFRLAMSDEEWAWECLIVEKLTRAIPGETLITFRKDLPLYNDTPRVARLIRIEDAILSFKDQWGVLWHVSLIDNDQKIVEIDGVRNGTDPYYGPLAAVYLRQSFKNSGL